MTKGSDSQLCQRPAGREKNAISTVETQRKAEKEQAAAPPHECPTSSAFRHSPMPFSTHAAAAASLVAKTVENGPPIFKRR